jgi:type II secretory pathway predicted ATPase ExeA
MQDHSPENSPAFAFGGTSKDGVDADTPMDAFLDLVESAPDYDDEGDELDREPLSPTGDFIQAYGLSENPFADAVNTAFFYRTPAHGEAIERMAMAVRYNVSLGMVTGASGTGKTLVSQLVLQQLDSESCEGILVLVTPKLSKTGLLREILSELDVALPMGVSRTQDLVKLLGNRVIDLYEQGKRLVIIIDECHFLSADCLHILRTISNIEIPDQKLVTCLLFGEPRFAKRLKNPAYDSIRNRMYMRAELQPMELADTAQYVQFRLMAAHRLKPLFENDALAAVHCYAKGICRSVSKLCMLSLIEGARHGADPIDVPTVAAAAQMGDMVPDEPEGST